MTDLCDLNGAARLKERIETYWRERDGAVSVVLRSAEYVPSMRTGRVDVRSDMLNGGPREWVEGGS